MSERTTASLYVVSTPIGNLGDMSARAIETLRGVSAVLAEDTRHSRHLLDHFDIATPLEAYHEHNEAKATPRLVERLRAGESLALISDAGTPLLSDPGARLVRAALEAEIAVVPIPGPSALMAALVVSGIDADRFTFFGFLSRRGRERVEALEEIVGLRHTAILYESPARLAATLADLAELGAAARHAAVARELTKQYEELRRGTVEELARYYQHSAPKGEVVIVIAGGTAELVDEGTLRERARTLRDGGASARDVARTLIVEYGAPRNLAYRIAQEGRTSAG
ncbi:MAG TPA: 16S rRNA (cytidine(1402)-2'-O)-methyltransferase [Gemmatimonadaceae bacterium]|nr:16S rRNA (cytidine(1402)-2'-O)-methyltransferase [Gemmatimonadaceae bacterium]